MTRPHTDERGSTSLELAVLTPVLLVLLALTIAVGRVSVAHGAVDQSAADAARAASLARTPAQAQADASDAAATTLAQQGLSCTQLTVTVDTSGFAVPVGQSAQVSAQVQCVVDLGDLAVPGLPGSLTETALMTSPLDVHRGR